MRVRVGVAHALVPLFFLFLDIKNIPTYARGDWVSPVYDTVVHHLDILNEDMPVAFGYGGGGW